MESQILQTHETQDEQGICAPMGVAIVTYNSSDVITDCLDSLLDCDHPDLRIVICDNNSPDDTVETIRSWAMALDCDFTEVVMDGITPPPQQSLAHVTLLCSSLNRGFAAGTNAGLATLLPHDEINLFWVLNPDCLVCKGTALAYAKAATTAPFSLMGGRMIYLDPPNYIQSDGGRINHWTGICSNVNQGAQPDAVTSPGQATLDYISGGNLVASRAFIEMAGLMTEDYFLYFEEVDWAFRRGSLPLLFCPKALVYHHGGTSIGSGSFTRRASGFANYFNYRNRMKFMYRHFPMALPVCYIYSALKVVKLVMLGAWDEAYGAVCGLHQLPPSKDVRKRLSPEAAAWAFGKGNEPQ